MTTTHIIEFELQEDLAELIENNEEVTFDDYNIKKQILATKVGTLLEVEKEIGSFTKIISIKEVDEELLKSAFV